MFAANHPKEGNLLMARWKGRRIQVHSHHECMLGIRERDKVEQACLSGGLLSAEARLALYSHTASETDISMQLPEVSSP